VADDRNFEKNTLHAVDKVLVEIVGKKMVYSKRVTEVR
jgi:hypothetical protein